MRFACPICLITCEEQDSISGTKCGHIFHTDCLNQWFQSKHNCPQCRSKLSENTTTRLYFFVADLTVVEPESESLVDKIDNLTFQLTVKNKEIKKLESNVDDLTKQAAGLRNEVRRLESDVNKKETVIYTFKDQCKHFKQENEKLKKYEEKAEEYKKMLEKIRHVELIVKGFEKEAEEIFNQTDDKKELLVYLCALKREMTISKQRRNESSSKLQEMAQKNAKIKQQLEEINQELEKKTKAVKYLTNQNLALTRKLETKDDKNIVKTNLDSSSEENFLTAALAPSPIKSKFKVTKPKDQVEKKAEENSPYMKLKVNNYDKPKRKITGTNSNQSTSKKFRAS